MAQAQEPNDFGTYSHEENIDSSFTSTCKKCHQVLGTTLRRSELRHPEESHSICGCPADHGPVRETSVQGRLASGDHAQTIDLSV